MVDIQQVSFDDQPYYKITDSDSIRPFFMSIVSDSNHWMFISSNGGLSAGRKNAEYALFPYYTDDKITESTEVTGSKSIFQLTRNGKKFVWEPFSKRNEGRYQVNRNLYKSIYGNSIIFEEINHDLQLTFKYQWSSSNKYGFVRTATIINNSSTSVEVSLLDGLQNILPSSVGSELQNRSSNLVDAYKRSELDTATGLGIFALSAIIVDKAEPSEALKANVAWSIGLGPTKHLLSALQLDAFRQGEEIAPETDVKGEKGAYFIQKDISLESKGKQSWKIVTNVNQDHIGIAALLQELSIPNALEENLLTDIELGTKRLVALCASADGLQNTADQLQDARHFSNVLFNIMRGGIFDNNYQIEKWDFAAYLNNASKTASDDFKNELAQLPAEFDLSQFKQLAKQATNPDVCRLCLEYLPLKFSRRHGDPSRPWNRFSINTRSEVDGSKILNYEGNWRDIFQNWEALAHSYPNFMEGMTLKFLNASTFDGYNPYRVTKDGFDWETIEADDPWSYIGYWGDHQIIYLLKFLEFIEAYQPSAFSTYGKQPLFVYANVPYKIKPYQRILEQPKDTIDFDHELDAKIRTRREQIGADGALLTNQAGEIHRVTFMEKILATVLAKVSNFIPEGGIWMNTQRPEWNDANNALVGNGVSMVTLYYLRRFLDFLDRFLTQSASDDFAISSEVLAFFHQVLNGLKSNQQLLSNSSLSDKERQQVLDVLGGAASSFREEIYQNAFTGQIDTLERSDLQSFITTTLAYLDHTIANNLRTDNLYHAYNLMSVADTGVAVSYLSEMLEGQVAVLSARSLSAEDALQVLDALKASSLYRIDQKSYILYPNKQLPGFLERNNIPAALVQQSQLLQKLIAAGNRQIINQDVRGDYHFNGNFKNAGDLKQALELLAMSGYTALVAQEEQLILGIFEAVFNHKEFTGRSGTFYGYEGLGSIYWHMVSKLRLAVFECCQQAVNAQANQDTIDRLVTHYYDITEGIGVHKSPQLYGGFPTDPYSHTPAGKGAQQPGMTGQVKEDILSRLGELGVSVQQGQLSFAPFLLRRSEFLATAATFDYIDLAGKQQALTLPANALCFTYCQLPVVYQIASTQAIEIVYHQQANKQVNGLTIDAETSKEIFNRSGEIQFLKVSIEEKQLIA